MSEDKSLFILMHSNQDWQKLLNPGAKVEEFLDWLWHQSAAAEEDAGTWVKQKIEEFKSL